MKKYLLTAIFFTLVLGGLIWDFGHALKTTLIQGVFCPEDQFGAITAATTKVAVVPSDYETLAEPIATNDAGISYSQIEAMVREALALLGGLDWIIHPGDKVLIKPNIVDPEPPGSGEVTDVRVVKALIKIIHEHTGGNCTIIVGEGSPREMDYELAYSKRTVPRWEKLWDIAGYQDLLTDPDLAGIDFEFHNLNGSPPENPWQDLVLADVPGGGTASPHNGQYWMHKDVLEADVYITVPVLKTHKAQLTNALKNQIGIAPSTKYGFSKTGGVPQNNYTTQLIHRADLPRDWIDEEVVDLCSIAGIDLVVVDALVTLERGKTCIRDKDGNITNQVRFNTIMAGTDPVAVDNVGARLIGHNPDDVAHITLAEKVGLGTNDPAFIHVVGRDVDLLAKPLAKDPFFTSDYGQSNRTWLLSPAFPISGLYNLMDYDFLGDESHYCAVAGVDGWSEPIYFFDDRIDLDAYFGGQKNVISYAFTWFTAPADQEAEIWLGTDESTRIFLNGELVHSRIGSRSYPVDQLVLDKVPVSIKAGPNSLLIKYLNKYGSYDFALNICEPEPDEDLDGNRVMDLKFHTESIDQFVSILPKSEHATINDVDLLARLNIATNYGSALCHSLLLKKLGTCSDNDIQNMFVYLDNGDGNFDPASDGEIARGFFQNGLCLMSFTAGLTINNEESLLYIACEKSDPLSAVNPTFGIEISDISAFQFETPVTIKVHNLPFQTTVYSLPVELMAFSAQVDEINVVLTWHTVSETNNSHFIVQRGRDGRYFNDAGIVKGHGTTIAEQDYRFMDRVESTGDYFYRLKQVDLSGTFEYSDVLKVTILPPQNFVLQQNYPNPFNPETKIRFEMPARENISLSIYSIDGRFLRTLYSGVQEAGSHTLVWDGKTDDGIPLSSGIYICVLQSENQREFIKMSLVR
ncbi:DUF362 domain-containing protein [candidate division KSB1 bacterium]|nr:DUF362 domain-containing protein [candidate division KSB1 bacterium]